MKDLYNSFKSDDMYACRKCDYYTDKNGFPNEYAFTAFSEQAAISDETYYLICLNIDLRKSNATSMAQGDYVLRKFIVSIQEDYYIFRIQGEKFNMLVTEEQIPSVKEILEKPSDEYKIYYGLVNRPYRPQTEEDKKELIREGITLMFSQKGDKVTTSSLDTKGNTPTELRETKRKKYRSTMWYSMIKLTITSPIYKEVTIYVYPTEWREALISIPTIVAVDDNVEYNVKFSSQPEFGIEGFRFMISCKLDREGHLMTSLFSLDEGKCEFTMNTDTHEGVCIPATFGKRMSATIELFPLKKNAYGLYDFILFDKGKGSTTVNTTGSFIGKDGSRYGLMADSEFVELMEMKG